MSRTRSRVIFIAPTFCQWITFSYVQNAIHASVRMSDPVVALGQLGRNAVRRRADGGCRLVWRGRWQHLPDVRHRQRRRRRAAAHHRRRDVRSEEHTSELQSLMRTSYAVFCLKKKKKITILKK